MTDFGFHLSRSSQLDLSRVDRERLNRLYELEPGARICMTCGSCGATCMAAPYSGMSVRKMLLHIERGLDVKPLLSKCMLCGKCTMVCPRGINTRNLILNVCKLYD